MKKIELVEQLSLLDVKANEYSLFGELIADAIIMNNTCLEWEVFYLDERGGRHNQKKFNSEENACKYVYKLFKESKELQKKHKLN